VRSAARVAALVLLLARGVHADAEAAAAPRDAKADVAALLDNGLSAAERQLSEQGGVRPFALVMTRDGRVSRLTPAARREMPAAAALLGELETVLRARAQADELEAAAIFTDVQITLPDGAESSALHAAWEHRNGSCANVFVPYTRESREKGPAKLRFDPRIVNGRSEATVFPHCGRAGAGPARSAATSSER